MQHRLQSGMRENPASNRRHDSRLPEHNLSDLTYVPELGSTAASTEKALHAALPHAATVGEMNAIVHERVPGEAVLTPPKSGLLFESLISSTQAAKLLGNLHVKTLQRYARLGRLPGYQIGRHWYFRESELDAWLRLQLNSKCQSVR
jgi:excisionase family DNA binding protein